MLALEEIRYNYTIYVQIMGGVKHNNYKHLQCCHPSTLLLTEYMWRSTCTVAPTEYMWQPKKCLVLMSFMYNQGAVLNTTTTTNLGIVPYLFPAPAPKLLFQKKKSVLINSYIYMEKSSPCTMRSLTLGTVPPAPALKLLFQKKKSVLINSYIYMEKSS